MIQGVSCSYTGNENYKEPGYDLDDDKRYVYVNYHTIDPICTDSFAELMRGYSPGQIENQNKGLLLEVQLGRKKKPINNSEIPQHVIEAIARCILPDIQAFYESEEGLREFAEWKLKQEEENQPTTTE